MSAEDRSADILVVEDRTSDLKLLSEILTDAGYRVRPATDGELALRSVQARQPDLILLDLHLPGVSGVEVCRRLKADAETRDIPVVFVSAEGESELKVKALEAGGVDYVAKPFERSEILARIHTHLRQGQLRRELIAEIEVCKRAEDALQRLRSGRRRCG